MTAGDQTTDPKRADSGGRQDAPTGPADGGDGRKPEEKIRSYALLEADTMAKYMSFYKHTYGQSCIDRKTKEFIALAAALTSGCKNCVEGHLEKAIKNGATKEEISEVLAITLGVSAATIVDRSDIAAANLGIDLDHWSVNGKSS